MNKYDVIIVGASAAGCAAAILYGKKGLNVALIERRNTDTNKYKSMCTHTIQASALPIINKLGILPALQEQRCIFTHHQIWSRHGWIKRDLTTCINAQESYGINVTRELLDPTILNEAKKYPTVTFFNNTLSEELIYQNSTVCGVTIYNKDTNIKLNLYAKLIVGADGAHSKLAKLAGVNATVNPNNRFGYFAYFKHPLFHNITDSKMWYLEPDIAYAFPNENGVMLLGYAVEASKAKYFKTTLNDKFKQLFNELPNSSVLNDAKQISPFYATGILKNIFRHQPPLGLTFIGDASLTLDPIAGVGITYAFLSAELLVNYTWKSLFNNAGYHSSAMNYYQAYSARMSDDYKIICNDSLANPLQETAQLIFSNATKNPIIANLFLDLCAKRIDTKQFFQALNFLKRAQANQLKQDSNESYLKQLTANINIPLSNHAYS